jgi:hypothetical protein
MLAAGTGGLGSGPVAGSDPPELSGPDHAVPDPAGAGQLAVTQAEHARSRDQVTHRHPVVGDRVAGYFTTQICWPASRLSAVTASEKRAKRNGTAPAARKTNLGPSARRLVVPGAPRYLVQRGAADLAMLVAGSPQLSIGRVLQVEQGVVGLREGPQDFVQLALGAGLMAGLSVPG